MPRILYDLKKLLFNLERTQPTATVKRHGGGIYGEIVFRRIVRRGLLVEAVYDSRRWLNPEMRELCEKHGIKLHDLAQASSFREGIQQIIDANGIEVFYTPLLLRELADIHGVDIFCTIHGLRDQELPADWFSMRYPFKLKGRIKQLLFLTVTKRMRQRAERVFRAFFANPRVNYVTVSEHSRSSICLFYPDQRDKSIPVCYSPNTGAVPPSEKWAGGIAGLHETEGDKDGRPIPYFLMVSGNRWEKNNLRAIIALDRLYSGGVIADTRTVVTGLRDPKMLRYRLRNPDKFIFPGYVDDDVLAALYRDAFCFIYPTLNEGFGYPPLEAMRFGTPIIVSPVTSVAEICGDGALYVNPYDISEMQMRIIRMLDTDFRKELGQRGYERYKKVFARQAHDLDRLIDFIYTTDKSL